MTEPDSLRDQLAIQRLQAEVLPLAPSWPEAVRGQVVEAIEGSDRGAQIRRCAVGGAAKTGREGATKRADPRHMTISADRFGRPLASYEGDLHNPRYVPREYRLPLAHEGEPSECGGRRVAPR